jgi:hypothetical protein
MCDELQREIILSFILMQFYLEFCNKPTVCRVTEAEHGRGTKCCKEGIREQTEANTD